ncbi:hypothetical protein [Craterilacuibacter sinensis]|uniref:Uncharacterized protein n=1 Tax=Craterilacuibacter sinensis TaxID=2686017 RepID=A0A845BTG7_9NEIS|nr:hypothetical protein [Craterilacuibacter sinensis]MXR35843.1 hypothetical protein [Craterilacuibacter sinensis]
MARKLDHIFLNNNTSAVSSDPVGERWTLNLHYHNAHHRIPLPRDARLWYLRAEGKMVLKGMLNGESTWFEIQTSMRRALQLAAVCMLNLHVVPSARDRYVYG